MISSKKKRIFQLGISLFCTAAIASVNIPVYAAPSSKELESKTSELQGELDNLNSELASLSKELDKTSSKIETLAAEAEKAKLDLAAAKLNEEAQYDSMKDRIKFMYEGGSVSLLNILFSSDDMADFLNKAEYVTTISEYDREMLDELKAVRTDVEQKQEKLETRQEELASLQDELSEKEKNLNSKISSTSGKLSDYNEQLERARAAEAALENAQDDSSPGSIGSDGDSSSDHTSGTEDPIPADTSDVALLAAVLECEAGASYDGMLAVATVIMNRVTSPRFPNSISEVIYQPGQFYPANSGVLKKVLARGPSSSAYSAAQAAIGGARHSKVGDRLFFYAAWYAKQVGQKGVNVGGNVFF